MKSLEQDVVQLAQELAEARRQLERANRIIGWMSPYIGKMATPDGGIMELNLHCCENRVPMK